MKPVVIGVLALQGDFAKHLEMLRSMGVEAKEVRRQSDLEGCDALIIPGGESTVISRQLDFIQMRKKLAEFAQEKPIFGTCAGLILMSKRVRTLSVLNTLNLIDVEVERNAFGRQVESFHAAIELHLKPDHPKLIQGYFIRAPRIRAVGKGVEILATYQGEPVLVKQGKYLGASFHPELTPDFTLHRYFVDLVTDLKSREK